MGWEENTEQKKGGHNMADGTEGLGTGTTRVQWPRMKTQTDLSQQEAQWRETRGHSPATGQGLRVFMLYGETWGCVPLSQGTL